MELVGSRSGVVVIGYCEIGWILWYYVFLLGVGFYWWVIGVGY